MSIEELARPSGPALQGEGPSQPPETGPLPAAPYKTPDRRSLLTLAAELKDSVRRDQMYRSKRARDSR